MHIAGISEQNRQPEPPQRKPNEDFFAYTQKGDILVAVLMDGIPVLRDHAGNYPEENGLVASAIAVETICNYLGECTDLNFYTFTEAFRTANDMIKCENKKRGVYGKKEPQWMATVGCALWSDLRHPQSHFGYIGDPLAFIVSEKRYLKIITDDQLRHFENHLYEKHRDEFSDPGVSARIREHQDKYVRNVERARCFCGEPLRGWGALTGEPEAMRFLVTKLLPTPPETRVTLASDAIEAIGAGNAKERRTDDYLAAFCSMRDLDAESAAKELLRSTRVGEAAKRCKSDDATFVVIDF